MRKPLRKKLVLILIVLLTMTGSIAAQGMVPRDGGKVGEPGFSLRYVESYGVVGEPYVFTNDHINYPMGLFVDSDGALYVAEQNGFRVMKFDADGNYEMSFGEVGQPWHHEHFLFHPQGVMVGDDGHVWVVIPNAIKEFDTDGNILQIIPQDDPWQHGDGNDRFHGPFQPIFSYDNTQLFVSEMYNHRVQIFNVDAGDNTLTYVDTINSDNVVDGGFNQPHGMAFDSAGRLYILDYFNHRVLRCELAGSIWTCDTFLGTNGEEGDALDKLRFAVGLYINGADEIFIADGGNQRILKCDITGDCVIFVDGTLGAEVDQLTFLTSITGDSDGKIYISDLSNNRVQVYDSSGDFVRTYGTFREPYQVDNLRLNSPTGVAVGPDGSIIVNESEGHRLVKMDANGNQLWDVGHAGVYGDDDDHFGQFWGGMEGNPAVNADNKIFMSDSPNNRVKVYDYSGNLLQSYGSWGEANHEFNWPTYIAVSPVNGDIYVTDTGNHRVQVFNANLVYKATIGITGQPGNDNQHFAWPLGIAIDAEGFIYVGDNNNFRIQKCALNETNYSCQTLIGESSEYQSVYGQVMPSGVAVDMDGRIYVTESWENRVQVFDSQGTFLTSVGDWGSRTSQFKDSLGITVDVKGDVYVVDRLNHRIQKFTIGVPDWTQVNINGFGVPTTTFMSSLVEFNGQLYAGTGDWDKGGRIWRSSDGVNWTAVNQPGFGDAANSVIISMIVFDGQLYASTGWGGGVGQIWRSSDGENWVSIVPDGFGNPNNYSIERFVIFNDALYASTGNDADGSGIWRSVTGNAGSWTPVVQSGNGNSNNNHVNSFVLFDGYLYAAGENWVDGAQVWRTANGANWTVVSANGFGNANNIHIGSIIEFKGMLYASTRNDVTGAEIFRSSNGTTWTKVIDSGINDPVNMKFESLFDFNDQMYVTANNYETGLKVWQSDDGTTFAQLIDDGFGDSNNVSTLWNSAMIGFKNHLYIGTNNSANGGELWRYDIKSDSGFDLFLPLILN